jgi:hypothetical protein
MRAASNSFCRKTVCPHNLPASSSISSRLRRAVSSNVVGHTTAAADLELLRAVTDAAERRAARDGSKIAAARAEQAELLSSVYEQLDETVFFSKGGWVIPKAERALIDSISSGAAAYGAQRFSWGGARCLNSAMCSGCSVARLSLT